MTHRKRPVLNLEYHPEDAEENARQAALLRQMRRREPTLLLCTEASDLAFSKENPASAFFVPRFPALTEQVLERASVVVTVRESVARQARMLGTPVHFMGETRARTSPVRKKHAALAKEVLRCCLISDHQYLPQTLGLLANLEKVHAGKIEAHILFLDPHPPSILHAHSLYRLEDLWNRRELEEIRKRPHPQQAYTSKARLCLQALRVTEGPMFYLDSDLYFFRSPRHLIKRLTPNKVLLFPHWNDVLGHTRLHGLFNAGMFGFGPGSEEFLKWWSELCYLRCAQQEGFFDDQGYLDLAPLYFKNIEIYRGCDENIAPWNVKTLDAEVDLDGKVWLNTPNKAIGSFHAVGPDPVGLFELKAGWDQIVHFFSERYTFDTRLLESTIAQQQRPYWLELENPLLKTCRKLLAQYRGTRDRLFLPAPKRDWTKLQQSLLRQ